MSLYVKKSMSSVSKQPLLTLDATSLASRDIRSDRDDGVFAFPQNEGEATAEVEGGGELNRGFNSSYLELCSTVSTTSSLTDTFSSEESKWNKAALYAQEGIQNDKFIWDPKGKWSKIAYKISHHPVFHVFDLGVSILLMLLALIEKPAVFDTDKLIVTVHSLLELILLTLVGVRLLLRFIWLTPKHFLKHRRTMFITLMLSVMFLEAAVVLIQQGSHLRITRSLRPVLFIDTYLMFGVRRVLRQIFQSLKEILDVILLLLFIVAFFSLIAYYLFARIDHDYFNTYGLSFVSLFITATTANNPDVMMEAYSKTDAAPVFFTIYLVITAYFASNILLAVVYSNFSKKDKQKFCTLFLHKREALHRAFKILTGPTGVNLHDFMLFMQQYRPWMPEWQVMCMFKALLENQGSALHENSGTECSVLTEANFYKFYEVQNLKWTEVKGVRKIVPCFELHNYSCRWILSKIHVIVNGKWFNSIIYLVVIVNTVFLIFYTAFITEAEKEDRFKRLNIVLPLSFLFILVYITEITLRVITLGPLGYFSKYWNIFDFVVLSLSLLALCMELDPAYQFLAVVRPIKLIRVIRLKKRYRYFMKTLVALLPRLISVFLLILIVYYFFAILGMEALQFQVFKGCCQNASYGVGTYYTGSLNESSQNVYYLNNFDNLLRSYSTLFILMVINNWFIIMEGFSSEVSSPWAARVYFICFYIFSLVVMQVVISFIVEAFVLQMEQENRKHNKNPVTQPVEDVDSAEDDYCKKEVNVTLHAEDLRMLKGEVYIAQKEPFSFACLVRKFRRKELNQNTCNMIGQRLRTKVDLCSLIYHSDIKQWITEQDAKLKQAETKPSPLASEEPFKEKLCQATKQTLTYLLD